MSLPPLAEPAEPAPPRAAPRRPDLRFLLAHPAHVIALGVGSGLSPKAPHGRGQLPKRVISGLRAGMLAGRP